MIPRRIYDYTNGVGILFARDIAYSVLRRAWELAHSCKWYGCIILGRLAEAGITSLRGCC